MPITVEIKKIVMARCDWKGCFSYIPSTTDSEFADSLRKTGWFVSPDDTSICICPEHKAAYLASIQGKV